MAMLTLCVAGACSHEDAPIAVTPEPTERATLGITIGVEGSTRAVSTDPAYGGYEPGSGYENYLDIPRGDYRIYFFSSDDKYIGTFEPFSKPVMSEEGLPEKDQSALVPTYYYTFMGDVPRDLPTQFKLVVVANWGNYPTDEDLMEGNTTISELCECQESIYDALESPGEGEWLTINRLIPFYGVREYNLNTIAPEYIEDGKIKGDVLIDLRNNEQALPLLRAMARVEVILDNPYASFSAVEMTKINAQGYCAPEANEHTDYYHGSKEGGYYYDWDNDFMRDLHLVEGAAKTGLQFKKVASRTENADGTVTPEKWVAYMPEYRNIGTNDFTKIKVTLADPRTDDEYKKDRPAWTDPYKEIYFSTDGSEKNNAYDGQAKKDEPGRFNIERNNVYRFTIIDMSADFTCDVDIQPFAELKLSYDLGLMRDERGDLMIVPDAEGKLPEYFEAFMKTHPYPVDDNGNKLLPQYDTYKNGDAEMIVNQDYYAIIMGTDGLMANATVWLKDRTGCQVKTNFVKIAGCEGSDSYNCFERNLIEYSSRIDATGRELTKDKQGEERVFHYPNHWAIVRDSQGRLVFKENNNDFANQKRYLVESWVDEKDNEVCWIIERQEEQFVETKEEVDIVSGEKKKYAYYNCTYYLRRINKDGTFTTGEEKENYIVAPETEKREVEE